MNGQKTTIAWPTEFEASGGPNPQYALGVPDGHATQNFIWLRTFTDKRQYSGLAAFLGVSAASLSKADIVAFELNGGGPAKGGGWESSTWFFTDGARSYAETFNELTGQGTIASGRRAKFQTGDMLGGAFNGYFGASMPAGEHVSWILIDVPDDINVHASAFHAWVSGADINAVDEGSPDPESVGVLH